MAKIAILLGLVACLACLKGALAHGGHFHGPYTVQDRGYLFSVIKSGTKVITTPLARKTFGPTVSLKGSADVMYYLYGNCTNAQTAAVQLVLKMTTTNRRTGMASPVANASFTGAVFSGPCFSQVNNKPYFSADTSSPDYNATAVNYNYIWFEQATTDVNGTIMGYGANDGKPKKVGLMKSVVLFSIDETAGLLSSLPGSSKSVSDYLKERVLFCIPLGPQVKDWNTALDGKGKSC